MHLNIVFIQFIFSCIIAFFLYVLPLVIQGRKAVYICGGEDNKVNFQHGFHLFRKLLH